MIPKFRAYINERVEMIWVKKICFYPPFIDFEWENEIGITQTYSEDLDKVKLMQSAGLKDKNCVEIFEGDIVMIDDDSNGEMKAKVVFEQGAFGLVGIDKKVSDIVNSNWNDHFLSMAYFSWEYEHLEDYLCNVVIIGNIHENPELLEAE